MISDVTAHSVTGAGGCWETLCIAETLTDGLDVMMITLLLQVLRAMLRGCWLLCWKWVEESVKANTWQPESDFEVQVCCTDFGVVQPHHCMPRVDDLVPRVDPLCIVKWVARCISRSPCKATAVTDMDYTLLSEAPASHFMCSFRIPGGWQGVQCPGGLHKPEGPRRARLRHSAGKPKLLYGMDEAIALGGSVTEGAPAPPMSEQGIIRSAC